MAKKKIVILGGGMAGLAAAYELTKTEELAAAHDVTLYQMGWRLGGKAASGRDALGRNLEHGLHVWFGCYENVFSLLQSVYRDRDPEDSPLRKWQDVAKPQDLTPIGVRTSVGWRYFPLVWPTNSAVPGDGPASMPLSAAWETLWDLFRNAMRALFEEFGQPWLFDESLPTPPWAIANIALPSIFDSVIQGCFGLCDADRARGAALYSLSNDGLIAFTHIGEAADLLTRTFSTQPAAATEEALEHLVRLYQHADTALQHALNVFETDPGSSRAVKLKMLRELSSIGTALMVGYLKDLWWPKRSFDALDDKDLREWLIGWGADKTIVQQSSILRVVYDTLFQFADGDVGKPSYAAGTALGVLARLIGTFKGSVMWDIQAGMGEALVAPLYLAMKDRVTFKFFHKVQRLEVDKTTRTVSAVHLEEQVQLNSSALPYQPLVRVEVNDAGQTMLCWPSEPLWSQLSGGSALRDAGTNFESHWCACKTGQALPPLKHGADFDVVVLAISMGAYKRLNSEDSNMCEEIADASPKFNDFVNRIDIVPTQSLQLWSNRTLEQLGWPFRKPASVSGPEYANIWADMSQVLSVEPNTGPHARPRSLHYLCGTFNTTLYREPASRTDVPKVALAALRTETLNWLDQYGQVAWPNARVNARFDFDVLTDFGSTTGQGRFDAQYLRANIDPTECCVLSAAGTTKYRLGPRESGLANLVLAGEATRHGFNTTSIEGAVMSGMAASRAICGAPQQIDGYDFLMTPVR